MNDDPTIPSCPQCGSREGFALFVPISREASGETFTHEGLQCVNCGSIFREADLDWPEEPSYV